MLEKTVKRRGPERPAEKVGIFKRGGKYFASADGVHSVPVERDLAENIDIALRVQDKVDSALAKGNRAGFLQTVRMMNCRKSIFAVTGSKTVRELMDRSQFERFAQDDVDTSEKIKIAYDVSGGQELQEDVERLLSQGRLPVLGTGKDMHFASYLDEHPQDVPAILHVFNIPKRATNEVVAKLFSTENPLTADFLLTKLHRIHTFLVLGKSSDGKYVAFQKKGPEPHQRFNITTTDTIEASPYFDSADRIFLTCIGPIPRKLEDKIERKAA